MSGTRTGRCHCGAVVFEVPFDGEWKKLRRCDCSLCRRKGAIMASVSVEALRIVEGREALRLYQWNTKVAEHWFCGTCGIYTHHRRRSDPSEYGINLGCVEGVDLEALGNIPWLRGSASSVEGDRP